MKSGAPVLLRADASASIGFGHLMRLAALADGLVRRNRPVIFLTRDEPAARNALRRLGLAHECVPAGASLGEDAKLTCALASRLGASAIVTDICHRETLTDPAGIADFHLRLKASGAGVLAFCGADYFDPNADVVVSPYVGLTAPPAAGAHPARLLLGPAYFIFRPEFEGAGAPREIAPIAERLLVTVGGSDPAALTARALDAFALLDASSLEVKIVIGSGFPDAYRRELEDKARALRGGVEWCREPSRIVDLMRWADLAITGDGLTKYETAVTGTPSIILLRDDSPQRWNAAFARAGSTHVVAPDEVQRSDDLARIIEALRRDPAQRQAMSQSGRALLDARGVERVIAALDDAGAARAAQPARAPGTLHRNLPIS